MPFRQHTLTVAAADEPMALRLLSTFVLGWDRVPFATQGELLRDAFVMLDGKEAATPASLMAFIAAYKGGTPTPEDT